MERVFSFLRSDSDKANLDWKQRARTNVERMSQGGLMGLAEVVKGLQVLSELRPLPTKERELYDNARHLLVAELAASLNVAEVDAEDSVDVVLFPPGRERPKRTAEEFRSAAGDEDGIELGDDLLEPGWRHGPRRRRQRPRTGGSGGRGGGAARPRRRPRPPRRRKAKPEKKAPAEKKRGREEGRAEEACGEEAGREAGEEGAAKPAKKPAAKPAAKKLAAKPAKKR